MLGHKYLFLEISTSNNHVECKKILSSREAGMKLMERELDKFDSEVKDLIYRDARKHLQEFICTNGLVFIINRI
jgi:hypothetical protein